VFIASCLIEVAADHEPPARFALPDPHLLDVQAVVDDPVAARTCQRVSVGGALAELLADDVATAGALQVGAVLLAVLKSRCRTPRSPDEAATRGACPWIRHVTQAGLNHHAGTARLPRLPFELRSALQQP
jgi:hypothetical protein